MATNGHYTALALGQPYPEPALVAFPGAGWHPEGGHHIVVAYDNIIADERKALAGPLRFDLCPYEGVLAMLMTPAHRPQATVEMVWAWSPGSGSADGFEFSDAGGHALVSLAVVEQTTGIIVGLRALTWSEHFTKAVERHLRRLVRAGAQTDDAVLATVARMRHLYPHPRELAARSVAHTWSGK